MACNEEQISAYLDGELAPTRAAAFADHIQECAECSQLYRQLSQLRDAVKAEAPSYQAPSHLRFQILALLDAMKHRNKKPKFSPWLWMNVGLSGICTITLVMSVAMYLAVPTQAELINQELVASHYRSLLANHLADVASSDHHTVKPWFTGKLDYAPVVNDFAADGFALLGGRLDYINKRTVAALAYRHNHHLINVFMWPDQSTRSPRQSSVQGFNLLQWSQNGMAYSMVSDMNAQELMNLRQLIVTH